MTNKTLLNEKLDLILKNQKKILKNEEKILGEEYKLEEMEKEDLANDVKNFETEEDAIKELKKLEKDLKKNSISPINKITKRDMFKGFIGAFVGIMGHFAFSKASDIAQTIDWQRATVMYIIAFIMIIIMLYYSGFRKVQKHLILKFMPLRATILYVVSIVASLFVNLLFGKFHTPYHFLEIYNIVGATIILAVLGAGTADLIGNVGHE
jgi:uncharacterized membrane protein